MMTTTTTTTTYTLKTRYGVEQAFDSVRAAKQYMVDRGEALAWERYDDNDGTYWAGYNYGGEQLAEIR
jgi:hypothetical protein